MVDPGLPEAIVESVKKPKAEDTCAIRLFKKFFSYFWPKEPRYIVIMRDDEKNRMVDNFFMNNDTNGDGTLC